MPEKRDFEKEISEAEKEKILAETEKFRSEKRKIDLETAEFEKNINKHWIYREQTLKAFVAGVVSLPILWFFFSEIIEPTYKRENIQLALENQLKEKQLIEQQDSLEAMKEEFDQMELAATQDLKSAWTAVEESEKKYETLQTQYDSVLSLYQDASSDTLRNSLIKSFASILNVHLKNKGTWEEIEADSAISPAGRLNINDHLLQADYVDSESRSPNTSGAFGANYPDMIMFHYTAGTSLEATVKTMLSPEIKAASHVVIGRNGSVAQLVPFNEVAWHAGRSAYQNRSGLNQYAIAINLVNAGRMEKRGNQFQAWFGKTYPAAEVAEAPAPNSSEMAYWHTFTDIQIQRVEEIVSLLMDEYNIQNIVAHYEVSGGRKLDPGPLFPLEDIRSKYLGK